VGSRAGTRKRIQEQLPEDHRERRRGKQDAPGEHTDRPTGGAGPSKGPTSEDARKTHSTTVLEDGTVCIGSGCSIVRIPPTGDITVDVRECDDATAELVRKRLDSGAGAEFKLKAKAKAAES
jgi:hypothetical protein